MSDEDYDDELPQISVNSISRDTALFKMPTAEELATQRAREAECERELVLLRASDVGMGGDSSGSEGDAALAAAVSALHVIPSSNEDDIVYAKEIISNIMQHFKQEGKYNVQFLKDFIELLENSNDKEAEIATDSLLSSLHSILACPENSWSEEELLVVGSWLCAAVMWSTPAVSMFRVVRALRQIVVLLESHRQGGALALLASVRRERARCLLHLSDALGAPLSVPLARIALAAILAPTEDQEFSMDQLCERMLSSWRSLTPQAQYCVTQIAGRLMAAPADHTWSQSQRTKILSVMATPGARAQRPDQLKVLVAASKLQLLFGTKNK